MGDSGLSQAPPADPGPETRGEPGPGLTAAQVRQRYDRAAGLYDLMESPLELLLFSRWRKRLAGALKPGLVLEVGAGTAKNGPHYPPGLRVRAIDLSPGMLVKARQKVRKLDLDLELLEMDVADLGFPDKTFDVVLATFVFCSVPDPVRGLKEMRRVCKPGGRLILIEHLRPENRPAGWLFDRLNPLSLAMMGVNVNRRTVDNVARAGWKVERVENLMTSLFRWIEARP